jgi:hypothetical protein
MLLVTILIGIFIVGIFYQYSGAYATINRRANQLGILRSLNLRKHTYKLISSYLLLRIGFVGGAEIAAQGLAAIALPGTLVVGLSIFLCLMTFVLLTHTTFFDRETKVSLATHFGSVSVGTFAAALAFLDGLGISYSPMVAAWVALMELPAVVVGILLLGQGIEIFRHLLREDRSLLLLPIALAAGAVLGPQALHMSILTFLFETAFEPALAYFLFEMGRQAGDNLRNLGDSRWTLIYFGIGMPLLGGVLGTAVAQLMCFSLGDTMILGTLSASASYVAAPTAMRTAIAALHKGDAVQAEKAVSTSLTVSLGITLPFNILIGLQLYLREAQLFLEARGWAVAGIVVALSTAALMIAWRKLTHVAVAVTRQLGVHIRSTLSHQQAYTILPHVTQSVSIMFHSLWDALGSWISSTFLWPKPMAHDETMALAFRAAFLPISKVAVLVSEGSWHPPP